MLHLLELPLVAAHRDVPPAPAARHHLQVVADDVADGARPRPSPSASATARRTGSSPSRAARGRWPPRRRACAARRAACCTSASAGSRASRGRAARPRRRRATGSVATPRPCRPRDRSQPDRRPTRTSRRRASRARARRAVPRSGRRARPLRRRGCRRYAAHVEVVDAAEADERGAHRTVVRGERHSHRCSGSCCSSTVLPAGSLIQICTFDSPWTPRLYSMPGRRARRWPRRGRRPPGSSGCRSSRWVFHAAAHPRGGARGRRRPSRCRGRRGSRVGGRRRGRRDRRRRRSCRQATRRCSSPTRGGSG